MSKIKKIKKVVIPAAGWGTRFLPMTKVVHKELVPVLNKPIIHYLAKEAAEAGIEEIVLVVSPRKLDILKYFTMNAPLEDELKKKDKIKLLHKVQETNTLMKVSIAIQNEQKGLGHAIAMASDVVGDEPFAVILGDDLIDSETPAIGQLIEAYNQTGSSIMGVQSVDKKNIHKYGVVNPFNTKDKDKDLFKIKGAVEKPEAKDAPSNKAILGRYIFTPRAMKFLRNLKQNGNAEINYVDMFDDLLKHEEIYAAEFSGTRYDLGSMEGFG